VLKKQSLFPYKRQNQCSVCSSLEGFLRFSRFRDRSASLCLYFIRCSAPRQIGVFALKPDREKEFPLLPQPSVSTEVVFAGLFEATPRAYLFRASARTISAKRRMSVIAARC
ncbi:hypothetical protein, partial [Nocardiopsis ganjiahuensis]|uniref:hypothetical protein n=1 Tax=Nocardiopsis ganjiahuensis TaxID=239984 RepID=UPI0019554185